MLPNSTPATGLRRRPLTLLLVPAVFLLVTFAHIFRTYDFVSIGMARYLPFAQNLVVLPTPSSTFQVPQRQGRSSLTIGSLNIRYSRDARHDSAQSMFRSLQQALSLAATQISTAPNSGSPYLMRQYWGERSWLLRGPKVADVALFHDWDLFALQEVLDGQLNNLVHWLGDEYHHAGVGRDDGKRAGEAVPIFWRKDVFTLVGESQGGVGLDGIDHFWLSTTPDRPGSVGWDAALTRMCTHVSLKLHATGEIVHVFSTHYDHQGVVARAKSSELIVHRARQASRRTQEFFQAQREAQKQAVDAQDAWAIPPSSASLPGVSQNGGIDAGFGEPLVILLGDLNSPRNEGSWSTLVAGHYALPENSTGATFLDTALSVPTLSKSPYLTDNEDPLRSDLAAGRMLPSVYGTAVEGGVMSEPAGALRTFTDFSPSARNAIDDRIDFVMVLDNNAVQDQTRADAVLDHSVSPPPPPPLVPLVRASQPHTSPSVFQAAQSSPLKKHNKSNRWNIRTFGVLPNWSEADAGYIISDHRPVMCRIERYVDHSTVAPAM